MPVPANELVVRSPIDGSEIGRAPVTALAEMPQVIERSKVAFASWRLVPAPRRGELVRLLGEELRRDKDALAALVTAEGFAVECGERIDDAGLQTFEVLFYACGIHGR